MADHVKPAIVGVRAAIREGIFPAEVAESLEHDCQFCEQVLPTNEWTYEAVEALCNVLEIAVSREAHSAGLAAGLNLGGRA